MKLQNPSRRSPWMDGFFVSLMPVYIVVLLSFIKAENASFGDFVKKNVYFRNEDVF